MDEVGNHDGSASTSRYFFLVSLCQLLVCLSFLFFLIDSLMVSVVLFVFPRRTQESGFWIDHRRSLWRQDSQSRWRFLRRKSQQIFSRQLDKRQRWRPKSISLHHLQGSSRHRSLRTTSHRYLTRWLLFTFSGTSQFWPFDWRRVPLVSVCGRQRVPPSTQVEWTATLFAFCFVNRPCRRLRSDRWGGRLDGRHPARCSWRRSGKSQRDR